jgi:uncharacterized protein YjbI with pentapeptide repeats
MDLTPDLEARFIEQEHRVVRVIQNFLGRKQWPDGDPRRAAARNAVIWRIFSPGAAAVATGGFVAIATLLVLVWQTELMSEQNGYFKEQNQKLQTQIDQQGDQDTNRRRTEIIAALYETQAGTDGVLVARSNGRTRGEAVSEFIQLERRRITRLRERVPSYQGELSLTQARLAGLNLDNVDLGGFSLVGAFLQNTSFGHGNLATADFRAALLESTSFKEAVLNDANFEGANAIQVSFARSDLRKSNLGSAGVRGCEFLGADLRGANLTGLREYTESAGFRFANVAGAIGITPALRKYLDEQGAVEIESDDEWEKFKQSKFKR